MVKMVFKNCKFLVRHELYYVNAYNYACMNMAGSYTKFPNSRKTIIFKVDWTFSL